MGPEAVPSRSNYAVRRTRTGEQLLRDRQPGPRGGDRGPARRTALGYSLTPACPNAEWQTDGRGQQRFKAAAAAPSKGFLHPPLPRPHPGKRGLRPARRAEPAGWRWPLCSGDPWEPGPGEVLLTPPPLSLAAALGSGASHPHFTEEQTEAQGSYPPKSPSWPSAGSGPRSAGRPRARPRSSPSAASFKRHSGRNNSVQISLPGPGPPSTAICMA